MDTLTTIHAANEAAVARYRRTWVEEMSALLRSNPSDAELESFVRTVHLADES